MSHTITKNSSIAGIAAIVTVTIQNYISGGETFTLNEFLIPPSGFLGAIFGTVPASGNSLAVPLFPLLDAGKVKLFRFVAGVPTEIPTTNNLNASVIAFLLTQ